MSSKSARLEHIRRYIQIRFSKHQSMDVKPYLTRNHELRSGEDTIDSISRLTKLLHQLQVEFHPKLHQVDSIVFLLILPNDRVVWNVWCNVVFLHTLGIYITILFDEKEEVYLSHYPLAIIQPLILGCPIR